jgi:hypothetical protein
MDASTFGGLSALTRGIVLRVSRSDGTYVNYFNAKTNGELSLFIDNTDYTSKAPSGSYSVSFKWKIRDEHGVVIRLSAGDKIQLLVQDNLTALTSFYGVVVGHIVTN